MMVPLRAATMGVPIGAEMSMPECMRPQRVPNSEVTVPLAGHIMRPPLATGGGLEGALPDSEEPDELDGPDVADELEAPPVAGAGRAVVLEDAARSAAASCSRRARSAATRWACSAARASF